MKHLSQWVSAGLLVGVAAMAGAEEPGRHHHAFSQDVAAFHGVLAPVWHRPAGPGRAKAACAKAGKMLHLAREIRSGDASALVSTSAALQQACRRDKPQVEARLTEVHDAFHGLIEH